MDNNFVAAVELDSTLGQMMTRDGAGEVAPEGSGWYCKVALAWSEVGAVGSGSRLLLPEPTPRTAGSIGARLVSSAVDEDH